MNTMIRTLALSLCFAAVGVNAHAKNDTIYLQELKAFKKSADHELMFDEDANPGLVSIQKSLEIAKDLTFLQRLARFMFLMLDPVIVTNKTMPQLYSYIDGICKKAGIATPTIFITSDKHGFFNAAAAKLFATTGGIIIGQKMIYETSQEELEAVLAHEIGHIKHNHINKIIALKFGCWIGTDILTSLVIESYRKLTNTDKQFYTPGQIWAKSWLPLIALMYGPQLIINKRFEKEADLFAFENGRAQGMANLFEDVIDREVKYDADFDVVYAKLQQEKSNIAYSDYLSLMLGYYLTKGGHRIEKLIRYVYAHTPLGDHPSHEARIQAAQDYLVQHSDWNSSQN